MPTARSARTTWVLERKRPAGPLASCTRRVRSASLSSDSDRLRCGGRLRSLTLPPRWTVTVGRKNVTWDRRCPRWATRSLPSAASERRPDSGRLQSKRRPSSPANLLASFALSAAKERNRSAQQWPSTVGRLFPATDRCGGMVAMSGCGRDCQIPVDDVSGHSMEPGKRAGITPRVRVVDQ